MLSEGTNTTMLVSPTGAMSNGFGFGDGNGWWIILLIILFAGGLNGFGGNNMMPYAMTGNEVQRGFDQQSIMGGINGIQAGVNGLSGQICNSFAQAEIANNSRQMASMQQMFDLSTQFANCCCENRLGIANLNSTILSENCADRAAIGDGIRDILASQSANTQRILDKLCDQELEAERRENQNLRSELMYARSQASQVEQTAQLIADNNRQTAILNPAPIPAYVVQNPNAGYSCSGCGSF